VKNILEQKNEKVTYVKRDLPKWINSLDTVQVMSKNGLIFGGWHPSEEFVCKLSEEALGRHRLEKITFCQSVGIERLTFVFSNGDKSPPCKTYREEPDSSLLLPE
jgi:hypothetical protein